MIWKAVVGYEGSYEVSDSGLVRSLDRVDSRGNNRKGKVMSLSSRAGPYELVKLSLNSIVKGKTVHTLVAEAFLGPRPEGKFVCHKTKDKTDNRVSNLEYGDVYKNMADDRNRDHKYKSKYPGVTSFHGKWVARLQINNKRLYLGRFLTQEEAYEAYQKARQEHA